MDLISGARIQSARSFAAEAPAPETRGLRQIGLATKEFLPIRGETVWCTACSEEGNLSAKSGFQ